MAGPERPPVGLPKTRLPGTEVDGHSGISIGHGQGVGAGFGGGTCDKSNVCNEGGEFDPEGALGGGPAGGGDHVGDQAGVAAELHAALLDVGAGDVEFVAGEAVGVFEDPDDFDVVFEGVAEDVGDDRRIVFS